jgi:CBS domain-containing protein
MRERRVREVMTADVVTIPPELPVIRIALLLCERGISAVPVVDADGCVLGIVTEADLLRRLASACDRPQPWLAAVFTSPAIAADRYARTHGFTAEEVMTMDVVTVAPDSPASRVAALMERHGVGRLPVVERGRLCGIVSRGDLLRAPPTGTAALERIAEGRERPGP